MFFQSAWFLLFFNGEIDSANDSRSGKFFAFKLEDFFRKICNISQVSFYKFIYVGFRL